VNLPLKLHSGQDDGGLQGGDGFLCSGGGVLGWRCANGGLELLERGGNDWGMRGAPRAEQPRSPVAAAREWGGRSAGRPQWRRDRASRVSTLNS
jgi:hypothetical protein